jgi:IS66 C-terminal element
VSISHTLVSSRFERDLFSPTNFQAENEMSSVRERTARQKEVARKGILPQPAGVKVHLIALGRKNHLFAGSDGGGVRWATVCSLIATAKLNNVEPFAWLSDVLQRMTDGHPANRLDELLPWNWQPINGNA